MDEPQQKKSKAIISKLLDIIEKERPDYYSLPVKEKNEIMKKAIDRFMKGEE